ncbi:hypothetical protein EJB05_33381, partial [Eragrostis curvula]
MPLQEYIFSFGELALTECKHELGALSEKYLHDKSTLVAECSIESRIEELEQASQDFEYSASEVVAEDKEVLKESAIEFEQLCRDFILSGEEVTKLPETIKNMEVEGQLERASETNQQLTTGSRNLNNKLSSVETELMRVYVDKKEKSLNIEKQISALNQELATLRSKVELFFFLFANKKPQLMLSFLIFLPKKKTVSSAN